MIFAIADIREVDLGNHYNCVEDYVPTMPLSIIIILLFPFFNLLGKQTRLGYFFLVGENILITTITKSAWLCFVYLFAWLSVIPFIEHDL